MKPLLKWAGGKRHIAPQIIEHFPDDWDTGTYFEPFLGGAAIFLEVSPKKAVLNDFNPYLVRFYQDVKSDPEALVKKIQSIARKFDNCNEDEKLDFFLKLREKFNSRKDDDGQSANFYALNKLCFNGLYRENASGFFNVPFGKKSSFPEVPKSDFVEASRALQKAKLLNGDFEMAVSKAKEGDFVYFDPPYVPLHPTSNFTSYNAGGFNQLEQLRLANLMKNLANRGVRAITSNSSSPITSEIFEGLHIDTLDAPRMVSAKTSGRGTVQEFLIKNF